jgi:hypothetical protein
MHIYLDDILISTEGKENHIPLVIEVLETLTNNRLYGRRDKCENLRPEVQFLGHLLTPSGIKPNPATLNTIATFDLPHTIKQLRGFLGTANYLRKLFPNLAHEAELLYAVVNKKGNGRRDWTEKNRQKFCTSRHLFNTNMELSKYNNQKIIFLATNASDHAVGEIIF